MRIPAVGHDHYADMKAFFAVMRGVGGREPPDVMKTLGYRPEFFGNAMCDLTQEIMRGPSPWSIGERELFAAYVASLNQCVF